MSGRVASAIWAVALGGALVASGCSGGAGLESVGPLATGSIGGGSAKGGTAAQGNTELASGILPGAAARGGSPSALETARALRLKGDKTKALAELERARRARPSDREIARELGLVALELGQLDKALAALQAAHDPAKPDFTTLSALGTVRASSGNQKEAQAHFKQALALKPDHAATLNNLALSYALDGDLVKAESTLKQASKGAAPVQVKENLALVLALAGKYEAAEKLAADVMPKAKVAANLAYLKSLKQSGG